MYKVVIADDEIIERKYLRNLFQKHKSQYQIVGEACNGEELLRMAEVFVPDIIIIDINMPLKSGLDAAVIIKKRVPKTIIVLNTAYAEFEFARKAVEFHLDAYLLKPATEQAIFSTLKQCIQNSSIQPAPPFTAKKTESHCTDLVADYINANFQKPIELRELANLVHFSPAYLSRMFHHEQGITISSYLNQTRIQKAILLLENHRLSIQEIALKCGFVNISHFNRVFKQYSGKSPAEIRKAGK